MTTALDLSDVIPLVLTLLAFIIGYFVFRNDQKNTNESVENKFESLEKDVAGRFDNVKKDIIKNEKRIRNDFQAQNIRTEKSFVKLEKELSRIHLKQTETGQDMVETKTTLNHLTTAVASMSSKLDLVIEKLIGVNNEKSKR